MLAHVVTCIIHETSHCQENGDICAHTCLSVILNNLTSRMSAIIVGHVPEDLYCANTLAMIFAHPCDQNGKYYNKNSYIYDRMRQIIMDLIVLIDGQLTICTSFWRLFRREYAIVAQMPAENCQ